jgi:hypothetical protein
MRYTPPQAMEAINAAFLRLPKEEVQRLLARKEALFVKHGMSMFTPQGKVRIIEVSLRPWVIHRDQERYFHQTCMVLRSALARLMPMYLADPRVRQILPLESEEHEWIVGANAKRLQTPQAVVDRLDATAIFTVPDWRENFWFLEPNSVGIGGIHYIPATCELTAEWLGPTLRRHRPDLKLVFPDDIRALLLKLFSRHARAIGRRLRRVALVEDQSSCEGTDEFPWVAKYLRRHGISACTADPRDLAIHRKELVVKGRPVDLIYRDAEITELLEMARQGGKDTVEAIRQAFVRNQVVSSVAGEFDHKSAWELLTHPDFSDGFTLRQRRLFKAHVLWTRLLWERKTTDPFGKEVDLVPFARRHREMLLIKPNRAYGGEGVVFGNQATPGIWERELGKAVKSPFTCVVQKAAPVQSEWFPVARPDGTVRLESSYAVTGFAATQDGIAFLGRASREAGVNVSRKGGLIAIWRLD